MSKILSPAQIVGILQQIAGGELDHGQIVVLTIMLADHHDATREDWSVDGDD